MTTARSWDVETSFWNGFEPIAVGARYRRALIAAASAVGADLGMPSLFRRMALDESYRDYRDPFWRSGLPRPANIGD